MLGSGAIVGAARVLLAVDNRDFKRDLKNAERDVDGFGRRVSGSIGRAGKIAALSAGAAGFGALFATFRAGAREVMEAGKVTAQTNAVIASTKGVANVTAKEVDRLANSIMRKTGIDDEQIKSAQNWLLSFTKVRNEQGRGNDIFTQATKITADLAVAQANAKGTAIDLSGASNMIGRALNDPIKGMTALSRAGVQFDADQRKAIKTLVESGRVMDAQKIILRELETQVGGSADAYGKTLPGQLSILRESFNNLAGDLVGKLVPTFQRLISFVSTHMPTIEKVVGAVGREVGEHIGRLVEFVQKHWDTIVRVTTAAFNAYKAVFENVTLPVLRALYEATKFVVDWTVENWPRISEVVTRVLDTVRSVVTTFVSVVRSLWDKFGDEISTIARVAWETVRSVVENGVKVIRGVIEVVMGAIRGDWDRAWQGVKTIVGAQIDHISTLLRNWDDTLLAILRGLLTAFLTLWESQLKLMLTVWSRVAGALWTLIERGAGEAAEAAGKLGGAIKDGVVDAMSGLWRGVLGVLRQLWENIKDKANDAKAFAARIGMAIADGIIDGLGDLAKRLWDKVWNAIAGGAGQTVMERARREAERQAAGGGGSGRSTGDTGGGGPPAGYQPTAERGFASRTQGGQFPGGYRTAAAWAAAGYPTSDFEKGRSTTPGRTASAPTGGGTDLSAGRAKIMELARQAIGTPYAWGGAGPGGFDCSGLVQWAFANGLNVSLPHFTVSQQNMTTPVSRAQALPGDLVFTGWGSDQSGRPGGRRMGPNEAGHVGIYAGGGMYINAGSGGTQLEPVPGDAKFGRVQQLANDTTAAVSAMGAKVTSTTNDVSTKVVRMMGITAGEIKSLVTKAAEAARERFGSIWATLTGDVTRAFDAIQGAAKTKTEKLLAAMDQRERLNAMRDAIIENARALETARGALEKFEKDRARLVAEGQMTEEEAEARAEELRADVRRAVQAHQEAIRAQQRYHLEQQAAQERKELDARNEQRARRFAAAWEQLRANLEREGATQKEGQERITALLRSFGITYDEAGKLLGKSFAEGLRALVGDASAAAGDIAGTTNKRLKTDTKAGEAAKEEGEAFNRGLREQIPAIHSTASAVGASVRRGLDSANAKGAAAKAAHDYESELRAKGEVLKAAAKEIADAIAAELARTPSPPIKPASPPPPGSEGPVESAPVLPTPPGGHGGTMEPMATGGIVRRRPGGMPALIGEGRYDEAVIPLPSGAGALTSFSPVDHFLKPLLAVYDVDRAILDQLEQIGRKLDAAASVQRAFDSVSALAAQRPSERPQVVYNVTNNFETSPEDPHLFTRSLQFELSAL